MAKDEQSRKWPEQVEAVYVLCHMTKEKARYDRLLPHLLSRGVPADKITICAPTWGSELKTDTIFTFYDPFLKRGSLPAFTFKSAGLTRGEISLGINLSVAIKDIATKAATKPQQPEKPRLYIILESDVWLREDFVPRLHEILKEGVNTKWDYISLGEGVGTRPKVGGDSELLRSYYGPTKLHVPPHQWVYRCTDSMLFTEDYMKRLSGTIAPFKEIVDWEMNFQLNFVHKGKALWVDPPLVEQGTCFTRIKTSRPA